MRITKVSVKKLFGIFDHVIPLNQDSRITIMHGPNGFGKTILLTMLNGLFNSNYRAFREVPFEEFRVYFDHQGFLEVSKENGALELSFTEVTGSYTMNLLQQAKGDSEWLDEIKSGLNVELIKTERLQTEVAIESESFPADSAKYTRVLGLAVEEYSAKTANLVHDVRGAQRLTQSELTELRALLKDVNTLLHDDTEIVRLDESEIGAQLEYIESALDIIKRRNTEIAQTDIRLTALVELLNGHFSLKRAFSDAESGLIFLSNDGTLIPVASLSSGEQHQLVLFSKLLFDIPQNSLVLIDEPELSLHVTWQHEFLNDLKRVIALCDFDVLIATHSPQIVHDKYDWMVDLHNPQADFSDDVAEYA